MGVEQSTASSQDITDAIQSTRKRVEWEQAQNASFPEDCTSFKEVEIKDQLCLPSKVEDWNQMDEVITAMYDSAIDDKLDVLCSDVEKHEMSLCFLKDCIYSCFADKFGVKGSCVSDPKVKRQKDQQMKVLRKKKRAASKKFKELRREGADENVMKEKLSEWRKLTRLHNKVRLQEMELHNKLTEIKNNTEFSKDPFKFIKKEVTKGVTDKSQPSCSKEEAIEFFKDRYSDPSRAEIIDFPEFCEAPNKPAYPLSIT